MIIMPCDLSQLVYKSYVEKKGKFLFSLVNIYLKQNKQKDVITSDFQNLKTITIILLADGQKGKKCVRKVNKDVVIWISREIK